MTSISPRLGLIVPTTADDFRTADLISNWNKIDASPGTQIILSSERATVAAEWTTAHKGRRIVESDTLLEWVWDGDEFQRAAGLGILKTAGGGFAIGERTTDFATTSETYVKVVAITSVVVPAGRRPIRVEVAVDKAYGTGSNCYMAIFRSNTSNSGPIMSRYTISGDTTETKGQGITSVGIERTGLPAGTYDFSVQVRRASSGTATLAADATQPISITVTEL